MGLPDPYDVEAYDVALAKVVVGPVESLTGGIVVFRVPGSVDLHVFSAGCSETDRMVQFRDHLRTSAADRELYARTKRDLAARDWKYTQQYADAKTDVVREIMARAGNAR